MENTTEVAEAIVHTDVLPSIVPSLKKDGTPRKRKEMKDFRILPGSKKLLILAENVRKNLDEMMKYEEKVLKFMNAFECSRAQAMSELKSPEGFNETQELRKAIRLSVTRPEVSLDGIFLARVAQMIAPMIGEENIIVTRTKAQKQVETNEGVK